MVEHKLLRKWIKALKSGKYTQTKLRLKSESGYCCLGVLCDLIGDREWKGGKYRLKDGKFEQIYSYGTGSNAYLPRRFQKELGINRREQEELSNINDNSNDFKKVIEKLNEYLN